MIIGYYCTIKSSAIIEIPQQFEMSKSNTGSPKDDPDTCVVPNPLLTPELQQYSCRTLPQWKQKLNNIPDDNSPNQFTDFNLTPTEDLVIDSENTLKTYKKSVANPSNIKGLVFMFHGLNSRVGHGAHIAQFLTKNGYQVVGFDHRAHGTSQSTSTADGVNIQTHLDDSERFIERITNQYPKVTKHYALGLSMGGLTSYRLANRFKAVILMAPAIQKIQFTPSNIKDYHRLVTANVEARKTLSTDPYRYKPKHVYDPPIAKNYGLLLMNNMQFGPNSAVGQEQKFQPYKNFTTPFMVVNGGCDRLVDPRVGFDLLNTSGVSSKNKQIYYQDDMWHNVWFDRRIITEIMPKALSFIKRF